MRLPPYAGTPSHVSVADRFDDASLDTAVWGTKVEVGGTGISEVAGELKIANAAGALGLSYLPSAFKWGNYAIIEVELQTVDGEAGGDGERCEASVHLFKDDDNYIKWGVYRDTSEAVNTGGYLRYNIAGAGEVAVDVTVAVVDNNQHTFKLILYESAVELWYDNTYQTAFAFPGMINYEIRLEAGTQDAGDTIDIRFDTFKALNMVDPFGTDLRSVTTDLTTLLTRLSAVRAGYLDYLADGTYGLAAIETLVDDLETRLSAVRAGYLDYLADGTYGLAAIETLVDDLETRVPIVSAPGSGTITLTNAAAVAVEFATATFGSVFELTFIADLNEVDTNGAADTILTVTMWKKIGGAYTTLPNDIYAWQKSATLDRNMDLDHIRCGEDTKLQFKLDLVPGANVDIPYRYIIRQLKV